LNHKETEGSGRGKRRSERKIESKRQTDRKLQQQMTTEGIGKRETTLAFRVSHFAAEFLTTD